VNPEDYLTDDLPEYDRVNQIVTRFFQGLAELEGNTPECTAQEQHDRRLAFRSRKHVVTLHHDGKDSSPGWGREATLHALDSIVPGLVERGYTFHAVSSGWIP
jgi:hypothetical protein